MGMSFSCTLIKPLTFDRETTINIPLHMRSAKIFGLT